MFYKKNIEKALSETLFRNPTSEYRGTPFWAWNCKLEKDQLCRQIVYLKEMGFGGFHMHSRAGMATAYLSDEWRDLICACNEKAKEEDMLTWLYDEDKWPSGFAGGLLTENPRYRCRRIVLSPTPMDAVEQEQALTEGKTYFMACYDVSLNDAGELAHYARTDETADLVGEKWYLYCEVQPAGGWYHFKGYGDLMNKEAMAKFVEMTHEFYKDAVGDDFGGSVPAIFTDEPQFSGKGFFGFAHEKKQVRTAWTPDFGDTFAATCGFDLLDRLPELFWDLPQGEISQARYFYHDHIAERFAEAFFDQIGGWCEKNSIMLTGHVNMEARLGDQTGSVGEAMRAYRGFQLPGIDILCDRREYTTAKQAQSASHQYGREGVLSELYGVTNWDYDFRGHKLQGDWQTALGITVRVPHLSWVSMGGEAKRDYPASINYQSPWYQEYKYVEDHFARVHTAMTRGKPVVKVGMIHPIESYWLHFGPKENNDALCKQMEQNFQNMIQWMLFGQIDFDYISEAELPRLYKETEQSFSVGEMQYETVIVPACETIRRTTLERLQQFRAKGGRVLFVGNCPTHVDAAKTAEVKAFYDTCEHIPMDRIAVLDALEGERELRMLDDMGRLCDEFLYQMRQDGDVRWLFIANGRADNRFAAGRFRGRTVSEWSGTSLHSLPVHFSIKGVYTPVLYDTLDGSVKPVPYKIENGNTVITRVVYQYDSLLLQLRPYDGKPVAPEEKKQTPVKSLNFKTLVPYRREEDNVVLLDRCAYALDDGDWQEEDNILRIDVALRQKLGFKSFSGGGLQPWVVPEEPITHYARLRFVIPSETEVEKLWLGIEQAHAVKLKWNGKDVPVEVCGYYVDESIGKVALPPMVKGENVLEVCAPIGSRTLLEACYLLGDFDVRLNGCVATVCAPSSTIGFGDITRQGMPFYGGNLVYEVPFATEGGDLCVHMPFYKGALTKVALDDGEEQYLVYEPYTVDFANVCAGQHTLKIRLFGNRYNTFASLHNPDRKTWAGPDGWRLIGDDWCYEYRVTETGVLVSPVLTTMQ